jgi:hypothetical protein
VAFLKITISYASRAGVGRETLQVRSRFRRDRLVWCTGIFGDPSAQWILFRARVGSSNEASGCHVDTRRLRYATAE